MALTEGVRTISIEAGADLSDSQFVFVNVNTSGQLALPSAGGRSVGVLLERPGQNAGTGTGGADQSTGFAAEVGALNGSQRLKVTAGGAITAGSEIKADASGHAVNADTEANNEYVLGVALETAADGDIFEFLPLVYRQAA